MTDILFMSLGKVVGCVILAVLKLVVAVAQVRASSSFIGFMVDTAALGQVFPKYFGFPCQLFLLLIAPQSTSPSNLQGWYNRPINNLSDSGMSFTPVQ
jgi:hypothetical protein